MTAMSENQDGKRKNHFLILKHHFTGKDDSLRAIGYLHGSTLLAVTVMAALLCQGDALAGSDDKAINQL